MTENKGCVPSGFFMNAERRGGGLRLTVGAVLSISELSEEKIVLVTHGAKLSVKGSGMNLSVFEGRGVELVGDVTGVEFIYAKT